eukprot:403366930
MKNEQTSLVFRSSSMIDLKENQKNQTLRSLTLDDVDLGDEGVLSLSIGLQSNTTIQSLNLQNNQVSSYGLENLLDCLEVNSNIQKVDLSSNHILDLPGTLENFLKNPNCTLQTLKLSYNNFNQHNLAKLLMCLKHNKSVQTLALSGYTFRDKSLEKLSEMIAKNKMLKSIALDFEAASLDQEDYFNEISSAFMKNQTLIHLETDLQKEEISENFIKLQQIAQANLFIIEKKDLLKDYFDADQRNLKNTQNQGLSLPAELEMIIRKKLELRKKNKPPAVLSNSSSASDLMKIRQPFVNISSNSHLNSQKNIQLNNNSNKGSVQIIESGKSFDSPLQKTDTVPKMQYYPSMSDISGHNNENEKPLNLKDLQCQIHNSSARPQSSQANYSLNHFQLDAKQNQNYQHLPSIHSLNPSLNLSQSPDYLNSEEDENLHNHNHIMNSLLQSVAPADLTYKSLTSGSMILNNTKNQQEFFDVLNQQKCQESQQITNNDFQHQKQQLRQNSMQSISTLINVDQIQNDIQANLEQFYERKMLELEGRIQQQLLQNTEKLQSYLKEQSKQYDLNQRNEARLNQVADKIEENQLSIQYLTSKQEEQLKQITGFQGQLNDLKTRPTSVDGRRSVSSISINNKNLKTKDELDIRQKCEQLIQDTRSQLQQLQSETDIAQLMNETKEMHSQLTQQLQEFNLFEANINQRLIDFTQSFSQDHQQKHLETQALQIIEERLNNSDERVGQCEKIMKEIHVVIQRYKNKNLEKQLSDRFEELAQENKRYQDKIQQKILDINNLIEQKCKKSVTTVYEAKLQKIETDLKSLAESQNKRDISPDNNLRKSQNSLKSKDNQMSYAQRGELNNFKAKLEECIKSIDKIKTENTDSKSKIKLLFEYFGSIEDKLEEQSQLAKKSMNPFETEFKSPIKSVNILDMSSPISQLTISPARNNMQLNDLKQPSILENYNHKMSTISQNINPVTMGHSKLSSMYQPIKSDMSPSMISNYNPDKFNYVAQTARDFNPKHQQENLKTVSQDHNNIDVHQPGLYERAFTFSQLNGISNHTNPSQNQKELAQYKLSTNMQSTISSDQSDMKPVRERHQTQLQQLKEVNSGRYNERNGNLNVQASQISYNQQSSYTCSEPSDELKQSLMQRGLLNILTDRKSLR